MLQAAPAGGGRGRYSNQALVAAGRSGYRSAVLGGPPRLRREARDHGFIVSPSPNLAIAMEPRRLRHLFTVAMRDAQFERHPPTWHWPTDELVWAVELNHALYGSSYSVEIGIWPRAFDPSLTWRPGPHSSPPDGRLPCVGDCPMSIAYEDLRAIESVRPPAATSDSRFSDHSSYFTMLMDLKRGHVSDAEREEAIVTVAVRLAALPAVVPTLKALSRRYAEGMFEAAFIHRDLRPLLESDAGA